MAHCSDKITSEKLRSSECDSEIEIENAQKRARIYLVLF